MLSMEKAFKTGKRLTGWNKTWRAAKTFRCLPGTLCFLLLRDLVLTTVRLRSTTLQGLSTHFGGQDGFEDWVVSFGLGCTEQLTASGSWRLTANTVNYDTTGTLEL
jgi:hypothetical protein